MAYNTPEHRATASTVETADEHATKESLIGTDRRGHDSNVSWGAVFAGVVTFLGVTVLLSLVTAGIGLAGSAIGAAIWSIIALLLALAAAGYVAGALAVRGGLLHGFLTWATSLVVALVLTAWLSASLLGAVGGAVGQMASSMDVGQVVGQVQENVSDEDTQEAQDTAEQAGSEVADVAQTSVWWTFVGMLIGAGIAAGAGMLGARSVVTRSERTVAVTRGETVRTR